MAMQVLRRETFTFEGETAKPLTFFQRFVLRRVHPRVMFINAVGAMWFFYFLYQNDAQGAVLTMFATSLIAYASVRHINYEEMAKTTLGKIGLLHLHPVNILLQTAGLAVLMIGLWQHLAFEVVVGSSFVLLGHLFGWSRVNKVF